MERLIGTMSRRRILARQPCTSVSILPIIQALEDRRLLSVSAQALGHRAERVAEHVALIPHAAALVKTLSVFHNVYMGRLDRHPTWYNLRTLAWPARREVGIRGSIAGPITPLATGY